MEPVEAIKTNILAIMIDLFAKDKVPRNFSLKISQKIVALVCNVLDLLKPSDPKKKISFILNELHRNEFYLSEYHFKQHLKKIGVLFECKAIPLVDNSEKTSGGQDERPEVLVFPLRDMYEALFSKTDLLDRILKRIEDDEKERMSDFNFFGLKSIRNLSEGTLWEDAKKILNLTNPRELALPMNYGYDDFQPMNPLGSKDSIFKLASKYAKIGVLPKSIEAKFKVSMQVATIFPAQLKDSFTNSQLFGPIFKEIKLLRTSGIQVMKLTHKVKYDKIKLVPLVLSGDNLGTAQGDLSNSLIFHIIFISILLSVCLS